MDTIRARLAGTWKLSQRQIDIVIGSLLGDGYLVQTTRGYAFRVNHGVAQREYVDWKFSELKELVNSAPRRSGNCYYFRTVSHSYFKDLRRVFYCGKQKVLPPAIAQWLSPLSLAVWIMDDGARDANQLRINTQCFSEAENLRLIETIKAKLGISATLNRDKNKFRLRVSASGMPIVRQLVAPHIIPSMQYKLSL
ncbi:MAG: hypothetical protein K1X83_10880 [Oligoflexia bacterium]|nr:hypothetical protein [Oligoflexia bacterium]